MYPVMDYLSSAEMLMLFGIASGVLSTFAYIPYIIDTAARRTQPQRASWLIWSVLGSIAFFSQVFEGASSSLWFAGVQVSGTIIVFVLSIWVGQGRYLSRSDHAILGAACIGLLLWYLTDNAAYALAITISISLLGGVATVVKAYNDPDSETLITWVVSFVASLCAVLSVGRLDFTLLAYPLYLFTLYLAFIVAIVLGRARQRTVAFEGEAFDRERYADDSAYSNHAGDGYAQSYPQPYAEDGYATVRYQESDAEAFEPQSARMLHNPSSTTFSRLFSGLRTTADAIIVGAAMVFVFNWLGANSSAVDGPLATTSTLPTDPASTNRFAANVQPLTSAPLQAQELSMSAEPTAERLSPRIIVVAVDRNGAEPVVLPPGDPLAQQARATARQWVDRDSMSGTVSSQALSLVEPADTPEQPEPANVLPADALGNFLVLDADDPFAQLIVTSDAATLSHRPDAPPPSPLPRLVRGEKLHALATNGEWYRVRVADGVHGYVHHTNVSVEALPVLSNQHTG